MFTLYVRGTNVQIANNILHEEYLWTPTPPPRRKQINKSITTSLDENSSSSTNDIPSVIRSEAESTSIPLRHVKNLDLENLAGINNQLYSELSAHTTYKFENILNKFEKTLLQFQTDLHTFHLKQVKLQEDQRKLHQEQQAIQSTARYLVEPIPVVQDTEIISMKYSPVPIRSVRQGCENEIPDSSITTPITPRRQHKPDDILVQTPSQQSWIIPSEEQLHDSELQGKAKRRAINVKHEKHWDPTRPLRNKKLEPYKCMKK